MNRAIEQGLRGKTVDAVEAKVDESAPKDDLKTRVGRHVGHSH